MYYTTFIDILQPLIYTKTIVFLQNAYQNYHFFQRLASIVPMPPSKMATSATLKIGIRFA